MNATKALRKWSGEDISSWLTSIGMKPYIRVFETNKITGRDLCRFTEEDLKTKCKITARPVRKILFKRLKHIQSRLDSNSDESENEGDEEISATSVDRNDEEEKQLVHTEQQISEQEKVTIQPMQIVAQEQAEEAQQLTPNEASFKIQGLYRTRKAHLLIVELIQSQYRKVYSLQTGKFVYKYVGVINPLSFVRSFTKLVKSEALTYKPILLYSRDLKISFTQELATMRIQLFTRSCLSIRRAREMARRAWKRIFDPISGNYFYYHHDLDIKHWDRPKILGNERWDPLDMAYWDEGDVHLYFRKLHLPNNGLIGPIRRFGINGQLLLALDSNDLTSLCIPENVRNQIIKRKKGTNSIFLKTDHDEILRRKKKLRVHFLLVKSAVLIQKTFRRYLCFSKMKMFLMLLRRCNQQKQKQTPLWWSSPKSTQAILSARRNIVHKSWNRMSEPTDV